MKRKAPGSEGTDELERAKSSGGFAGATACYSRCRKCCHTSQGTPLELLTPPGPQGPHPASLQVEAVVDLEFLGVTMARCAGEGDWWLLQGSQELNSLNISD